MAKQSTAVNFHKLSKDELKSLAEKWQGEAESMETKIERCKNDPERLERLWYSANKVWGEIRRLERFNHAGALKAVS